MTTANQIIAQALGLIGVRTASDPVQGTDAALCFERLNTLVDAMRTGPLNAYATQALTGTIPANTASITIGPSGTIVTANRPIRIENAYFSAGGVDYVIEPVTEEEMDSIALKNTTSLGPTVMFYDAALSNGTLTLFPKASSTVPLTMKVLTQIVEFDDLTTDYELAPGYRRYLAYALAEEVCPDFERDVPPLVHAKMIGARRAIQRLNNVVPQLNSGIQPMNHLQRMRAGY